jgi:hypothetical protein
MQWRNVTARRPATVAASSGAAIRVRGDRCGSAHDRRIAGIDAPEYRQPAMPPMPNPAGMRRARPSADRRPIHLYRTRHRPLSPQALGLPVSEGDAGAAMVRWAWPTTPGASSAGAELAERSRTSRHLALRAPVIRRLAHGPSEAAAPISG